MSIKRRYEGLADVRRLAGITHASVFDLDEVKASPGVEEVLGELVKALEAHPKVASVKQQRTKLVVKLKPGVSPELDYIEYLDIRKPVAKWRYVLKDGRSGWGWSGMFKRAGTEKTPEALTFDEPHNVLKYDVILKNAAESPTTYSIPAQMQAHLANNALMTYVLDRMGKVFDLNTGGYLTASEWTAREQTKAAEAEAKRKAAEDAEKAAAEKATKAREEQSAEFVAGLFRDRSTKTGGKLRVTQVEKDYIDIDPANRQRLDHYGTSYDDEGEEQEGWSDEWYEDYANPLGKEVEAILASYGVTKWAVEIGEKGHISLMRSAK